ncbi:MAG TPA: alanine--tRNA ligase-related protein, partial [Balneolaceae bacterium]|nr:alanine--tRNA ligase-related protein [Balneolaceae bacterium]
GIELFNEIAEGRDIIPGDSAFKLHDTYGFPIDLTRLMARERGLEVDLEGFQREMEKQKRRARAAGNFRADKAISGEWVEMNGETESTFVGYDELETATRILAYRKSDDQASLILEKTPFYAESGGQVADTGIITRGDMVMKVRDVQKSDRGFIHVVDRLADDLSGEWQARVDRDRRREIKKHHTATHLVHEALRRVLGDHVAQKGSLVDENHLRFDFSHYEQMSQDQLDKVEQIVNAQIQRNIRKDEQREVPIREAKERGATMLFGEKYGEKVRVITFDPDYSMELCGGTHAEATGELGYFRFLSESSAAAGVRRIEAVAGQAADEFLRKEKNTMSAIKAVIGDNEDPASAIRSLLEERKNLKKLNTQLKHQQAADRLNQFIERAREIETGVLLVRGELPQADMDLLKQLGYEALEKRSEGTITVLGSRDQQAGKALVVATVTRDLIKQRGIKAGTLVREFGKKLGGGGGGQPDLATAGGSKPEKLDAVLEEAESFIKDLIDHNG